MNRTTEAGHFESTKRFRKRVAAVAEAAVAATVAAAAVVVAAVVAAVAVEATAAAVVVVAVVVDATKLLRLRNHRRLNCQQMA